MSLLERDRCALIVVDVQEGFRSYASFARVADGARKLVQAARIMGVPIVVSEQYPKGLGRTAPEVGLGEPDATGGGSGGAAPGQAEREGTQPGAHMGELLIEKTVFSAVRAEGFDRAEIGRQGRDQAIVCGIETHVCVSQTAQDLLAGGVEVHVPADATGSRHELDQERGLQRLERAGAVVSTVESDLFELLERAGTPEFKAVQKLII